MHSYRCLFFNSMKRIISIFTFLALSICLLARPVSLQRAQRFVEEHFFTPAVCISPAEWDEIYVFAPEQGTGFVILSADDCTRPVLGYSYSTSFRIEGMPAHVAAWLDGYRQEIASLRKVGATPSAAVQAMWQQPKRTLTDAVAPLLTTTWNQSPWYNSMCPYSNNDSAHAVTGCVATAQAQVMKYWNHPVRGHGSHSYGSETFGPLSVDFDTAYQWSLMPNNLYWGSSQEEIHAVAQLMYHIGVAVEMGYGVGGSGAYLNDYSIYGYSLPSAELSLREHFGYNPMIEDYYKDFITDAVWSQMIRNEISHRRPVLYAGSDESGGHAFVLDGYDTLGMFHVNWGWGGHLDGYYTIDSLSPGAGGIGGNATYTFNLHNRILLGVRPCYNDDSLATIAMVSADSSKGMVTGNGTYVPYEDTVEIRVVPVEGYRFDGWASGYMGAALSFVPNGDFEDTAFFAPIGTDTVAYCTNDCVARWHDDYGNVTEWGIRVPASLRNSTRSLTAVQVFVQDPGYYTMKVYCGENISSSTHVLTVQPDFTEVQGWTTVELDEPVFVPDNQPVWITFSFTTTTGLPATASIYTGVSDGCWYKLPGGWQPIDQTGVYLTWMIRALFSERLCRVAIENAGYCELDAFQGAGDYPLGTTVTVSVSDPSFSHWEGIATTDTAITFTVTGDTTFYAYCHDVGIDEVEDATDLDQPVSIYDMSGRLVANRRDDVRLLPAGVYLLRQGPSIIKKIVVL